MGRRAMELLEASSGLVCPITQELMREPVIGTDGYTYERVAIESWVRAHGTSPMTRERMSLADLRPNRAIKDQIQWLLRDNPRAAAELSSRPPPSAPSSCAAEPPPQGLKAQLKADLLGAAGSARPSAPPASPHFASSSSAPSAPPLPLNGFASPPPPRESDSGRQRSPQRHQAPPAGTQLGGGKQHKPKHKRRGKEEDLYSNVTYGKGLAIKDTFKPSRDMKEGGGYGNGVVVTTDRGCTIM